MAAGDTTQGRRLDIVYVDGKPDLNQCMPTEPGDYVGPILGYTGPVPAVYFMLPHARDVGTDPQERGIRHVTSPPHSFTEESDGTLTISASILCILSPDSRHGWHGYLERGVWREV